MPRFAQSDSGVGSAVPGSKAIGLTSIRSMRESLLICTRPIQLTGSAIALIATERTALQIASLKSNFGSPSLPPTGNATLMSPRLSFISEVSMPSGNPMRFSAVSCGLARTS